MKADGRKPSRRYAPAVEAMDSLRLMDASAPGLAPLAFDHQAFDRLDSPGLSDAARLPAWDLALESAGAVTGLPPDVAAPVVTARPEDLQRGLAQLDRYLARAWARAGIPPQQADDCSQAVYATLLQGLGRPEFDRVVASVGRQNVPQVLSRETEFGPDFFRAVDMVKKRAVRERSHQALDEQLDVPATGDSSAAADGDRLALQEAIRQVLSRREADLIQATLQGFSPAEIAAEWGVAPKTVSNEKTRVFQKLREALTVEA